MADDADIFEIGMVGLGKMGGNMRERLRGGRPSTVVGYDRNPDVSDASAWTTSSQRCTRRAWCG